MLPSQIPRLSLEEKIYQNRCKLGITKQIIKTLHDQGNIIENNSLIAPVQRICQQEQDKLLRGLHYLLPDTTNQNSPTTDDTTPLPQELQAIEVSERHIPPNLFRIFYLIVEAASKINQKSPAIKPDFNNINFNLSFQNSLQASIRTHLPFLFHHAADPNNSNRLFNNIQNLITEAINNFDLPNREKEILVIGIKKFFAALTVMDIEAMKNELITLTGNMPNNMFSLFLDFSQGTLLTVPQAIEATYRDREKIVESDCKETISRINAQEKADYKTVLHYSYIIKQIKSILDNNKKLDFIIEHFDQRRIEYLIKFLENAINISDHEKKITNPAIENLTQLLKERFSEIIVRLKLIQQEIISYQELQELLPATTSITSNARVYTLQRTRGEDLESIQPLIKEEVQGYIQEAKNSILSTFNFLKTSFHQPLKLDGVEIYLDRIPGIFEELQHSTDFIFPPIIKKQPGNAADYGTTNHILPSPATFTATPQDLQNAEYPANLYAPYQKMIDWLALETKDPSQEEDRGRIRERLISYLENFKTIKENIYKQIRQFDNLKADHQIKSQELLFEKKPEVQAKLQKRINNVEKELKKYNEPALRSLQSAIYGFSKHISYHDNAGANYGSGAIRTSPLSWFPEQCNNLKKALENGFPQIKGKVKYYPDKQNIQNQNASSTITTITTDSNIIPMQSQQSSLPPSLRPPILYLTSPTRSGDTKKTYINDILNKKNQKKDNESASAVPQEPPIPLPKAVQYHTERINVISSQKNAFICKVLVDVVKTYIANNNQAGIPDSEIRNLKKVLEFFIQCVQSSLGNAEIKKLLAKYNDRLPSTAFEGSRNENLLSSHTQNEERKAADDAHSLYSKAKMTTFIPKFTLESSGTTTTTSGSISANAGGGVTGGGASISPQVSGSKSKSSNQHETLSSAPYVAIPLSAKQILQRYHGLWSTLCKSSNKEVDNLKKSTKIPISDHLLNLLISTAPSEDKSFLESCRKHNNTLTLERLEHYQHFIPDQVVIDKISTEIFSYAYGQPLSEPCIVLPQSAYQKALEAVQADLSKKIIDTAQQQRNVNMFYNNTSDIGVVIPGHQGSPQLLLSTILLPLIPLITQAINKEIGFCLPNYSPLTEREVYHILIHAQNVIVEENIDSIETIVRRHIDYLTNFIITARQYKAPGSHEPRHALVECSNRFLYDDIVCADNKNEEGKLTYRKLTPPEVERLTGHTLAENYTPIYERTTDFRWFDDAPEQLGYYALLFHGYKDEQRFLNKFQIAMVGAWITGIVPEYLISGKNFPPELEDQGSREKTIESWKEYINSLLTPEITPSAIECQRVLRRMRDARDSVCHQITNEEGRIPPLDDIPLIKVSPPSTVLSLVTPQSARSRLAQSKTTMVSKLTECFTDSNNKSTTQPQPSSATSKTRDKKIAENNNTNFNRKDSLKPTLTTSITNPRYQQFHNPTEVAIPNNLQKLSQNSSSKYAEQNIKTTTLQETNSIFTPTNSNIRSQLPKLTNYNNDEKESIEVSQSIKNSNTSSIITNQDTISESNTQPSDNQNTTATIIESTTPTISPDVFIFTTQPPINTIDTAHHPQYPSASQEPNQDTFSLNKTDKKNADSRIASKQTKLVTAAEQRAKFMRETSPELVRWQLDLAAEHPTTLQYVLPLVQSTAQKNNTRNSQQHQLQNQQQKPIPPQYTDVPRVSTPGPYSHPFTSQQNETYPNSFKNANQFTNEIYQAPSATPYRHNEFHQAPLTSLYQPQIATEQQNNMFYQAPPVNFQQQNDETNQTSVSFYQQSIPQQANKNIDIEHMLGVHHNPDGTTFFMRRSEHPFPGTFTYPDQTLNTDEVSVQLQTEQFSLQPQPSPNLSHPTDNNDFYNQYSPPSEAQTMAQQSFYQNENHYNQQALSDQQRTTQRLSRSTHVRKALRDAASNKSYLSPSPDGHYNNTNMDTSLQPRSNTKKQNENITGVSNMRYLSPSPDGRISTNQPAFSQYYQSSNAISKPHNFQSPQRPTSPSSNGQQSIKPLQYDNYDNNRPASSSYIRKRSHSKKNRRKAQQDNSNERYLH